MADQKLTHVDAKGDARMVDVGSKADTERTAIARGHISLSPEAMALVVERSAKKGDVLAIAQLAGILGAKRTSDLIPLCHPIPIDSVEVTLRAEPERGLVSCVATVRTVWRTGVEMEALCAVSAALLTVYDMLKAVDRGMSMGPIELVHKSGGRSGTWDRGA